MFKYQNVCIVGGRPAGIAVVVALARQNRRITIVDCAGRPSEARGLRRTALHEIHRAAIKHPQTMANPRLLLDRERGLRRRLLASLAGQPNIFESLFTIHVGASRFQRLWS